MSRCGSYPRRSPGRCSNQEHRGLCTFEDIVDAYERHYRSKRKEMRSYATRPSSALAETGMQSCEVAHMQSSCNLR
jgi:hypothetical protein